MHDVGQGEAMGSDGYSAWALSGPGLARCVTSYGGVYPPIASAGRQLRLWVLYYFM